MHKVDSEDRWILFVIAVALAALVIWKFSAYAGLDRRTGGLVLARMAVLVVASRLSWEMADDFPSLRPGNIWPILLVLLWLCWWPALDFWAGKAAPSFVHHEEAPPWWAAWYAKWGGLAGIAALGYLAKRMFRGR